MECKSVPNLFLVQCEILTLQTNLTAAPDPEISKGERAVAWEASISS